METEKLFTQAELDEIKETVKNQQKANFDKYVQKNYVEKAEYDKLLSSFNDLQKQVKGSSVKQAFLAKGGKETAFNDFLNNHQELLSQDQEKLETSLNDLKSTKSFYFEADTLEGLDDNLQLKELFGDTDNDGLVEDSIYPKSFYSIVKK